MLNASDCRETFKSNMKISESTLLDEYMRNFRIISEERR